jgi:hypothetical protein
VDKAAAGDAIKPVEVESDHESTSRRGQARGGVFMSTKNDYSDAEWKAISTAPVAAGLLITASDASGLAQEVVVVGHAISTSTLGDAPEIVKVLTHHIKAGGGTPDMPDLPGGGHAPTKAALISVVRAAVGALQRKSPAEAESYKAWLASVTAKVSCASMEGRRNGNGRPQLNPDEDDALRQLTDVLAVSLGTTPLVARRS